MGSPNFSYRMKVWFQKLRSKTYIVIFSLLAILVFGANYLAKLIVDDTLTTLAKNKLVELFPKLSNQISTLFFTKPYFFMAMVIILIFFLLVIIAFIQTNPPKGFYLHKDDTPLHADILIVKIGNNTDEDWISCQVTLDSFTKIKAQVPNTINYRVVLPQVVQWFSRDGLISNPVEIQSKRDPVSLAVALRKVKDGRGILTAGGGVTIYPGIYTGKFYFSGETRQGKDISKTFYITYKVDDIKNVVEITKVK